MEHFELSSAEGVEPGILADLRVEAMRPSLEAAGRFDPQRARARFLATFAPEDTRVLWAGGAVIGFFVLRDRADHLYLDHLYIRPDLQGSGIGRRIVSLVQDQARMGGVPVRLTALKGSAANGFYLSCGFALEGQDALDNFYIWRSV